MNSNAHIRKWHLGLAVSIVRDPGFLGSPKPCR